MDPYAQESPDDIGAAARRLAELLADRQDIVDISTCNRFGAELITVGFHPDCPVREDGLPAQFEGWPLWLMQLSREDLPRARKRRAVEKAAYGSEPLMLVGTIARFVRRRAARPLLCGLLVTVTFFAIAAGVRVFGGQSPDHLPLVFAAGVIAVLVALGTAIKHLPAWLLCGSRRWMRCHGQWIALMPGVLVLHGAGASDILPLDEIEDVQLTKDCPFARLTVVAIPKGAVLLSGSGIRDCDFRYLDPKEVAPLLERVREEVSRLRGPRCGPPRRQGAWHVEKA